jgi:predicted transcriptional regulator of viral defense system
MDASLDTNVIIHLYNEKVDIGDEKVDIGFIENYLSYVKVNLPTKEKIKIVYLKFAAHTIFSRTDIAELLEISPTSASVLVTKMYKVGLVDHGYKGYRFFNSPNKQHLVIIP